MCAIVNLELFLKPMDMLGCCDGDPLCKEDVLELATNLHNDLLQTADILGRLVEDGWETSLRIYDIDCSPPKALTVRQAKARLRKLGIDPKDVDIRKVEYDDDDEQLQETDAV